MALFDVNLQPKAPAVLPAVDGWDLAGKLKIQPVRNPLTNATLGDLGVAVDVTGPANFSLTLIVLPVTEKGLAGIDPGSVRMFRYDEKSKRLVPVWNSGINVHHGFVWAKVQQPGTYVPIGLPADLVLKECLRMLTQQRDYLGNATAEDLSALSKAALAQFLELSEPQLATVRKAAAVNAVHFSTKPVPPHLIERGEGFHITGLVLPGGATVPQLKEQIAKLQIPAEGLPEEQLFWGPEQQAKGVPLTVQLENDSALANKITGLLKPLKWPWWPPFPFPICWLFSQNWPMYHHDQEHSGHASGCSGLTSTTVQNLVLKKSVPVPEGGQFMSIPSIVDGKVYIGSTSAGGGSGGYMYKIDIVTGNIDHKFGVPNRPAYSPGIGGSPAIVNGKVYFTALPGYVYCLDANTFNQIWSLDLRNANAAMNQPVNNPVADSWSSPVVANGKVYIGCGEGESQAYGFVYCLDANTGHVIWLYSTDQFVSGTDNQPNVIPAGAVGINPLPPGFTSHADPPHLGASVWSSCAYDAGLNRIYFGLGNSSTGAGPAGAIDYKYGSGVLALDAGNGAFKGYFQPTPSDSYYPGDSDIDISSSPTLFTRGGQRVLAIGSKSGAFMILDANSMAKLNIRNVLPRDAVTGGPLPGIDDLMGGGNPGGKFGGENRWGVFCTAAVHYGLGRLFVGLGGYEGIANIPTTPFMRALDWNNLNDAWPIANQTISGHPVAKYIVPVPPMYQTSEAGCSSPAVTNDVVFVSTTKSALYAMDVNCGLCLWSAPSLPAGQFVLGPAISGNYVVVGAGGTVFIYSL
ncbi:MAG TPA: PQQ-binding-like beta-propeller repeat protein [Candidatus Angelobacter sp.]